MEGAEHTPRGPGPTTQALRAQLLATEHWGLLAARGTTQSELLTRISILLTLVSAGLITIGLLGQATAFRAPFPIIALGILALVWLVGVLTQVRVVNAGEDDQVFVTGMNRIRAGYVDLDPGVEQYFVTSAFDDTRGIMQTYSPIPRHPLPQVLGSSSVLILLINSCTSGLVVGTLVALLGAPGGVAVVVGAIGGLTFAAVSVATTVRRAVTATRAHVPLRPHPPEGARRGDPTGRGDAPAA